VTIDPLGLAARILDSVFSFLRRRARLDLRLTGAFDQPFPDDDGEFQTATIDVYNPTPYPIWIESAGFELKSGKRLQTNTGSRPLRHHLQPHDRIQLGLDVLTLATGGAKTLAAARENEPDPPRRAWVERWHRKFHYQKVSQDWLERWTTEANRRLADPFHE
jgi:hypothetical protein